MIPRETLDDLMKRADALIASVRFDNSGSIIAGHYRGGNGGLLSHDTEKAADDLANFVAKIRQFYPPVEAGAEQMQELTGIMGEVLAQGGYRGDKRDLRLFVDRVCERMR